MSQLLSRSSADKPYARSLFYVASAITAAFVNRINLGHGTREDQIRIRGILEGFQKFLKIYERPSERTLKNYIGDLKPSDPRMLKIVTIYAKYSGYQIVWSGNSLDHLEPLEKLTFDANDFIQPSMRRRERSSTNTI